MVIHVLLKPLLKYLQRNLPVRLLFEILYQYYIYLNTLRYYGRK